MTLCGDECVDLAIDGRNCGACGWNVLPPRTCLAGKPNPAWVPMSNAARPSGSSGLVFWTGKRLLVASSNANEAYGYDLETNTWSVLPAAYRPPFPIPDPNQPLAVLSEISTTFVWSAPASPSMAATNTAFVFVDGQAPGWTPVTTSGAPSPRRQPGVARAGMKLFVLFGFSGTSTTGFTGHRDGSVYDLVSQNWTPVIAIPGGVGPCPSQTMFSNPIAIAGGAVATAFGVGTITGQTCLGPSLLTNNMWAAASGSLGGRRAARWLSVNGRFVALGGLDVTGPAPPASAGIDYTGVVLPNGAVHDRPNTYPLVASSDAFAVAAGRSVILFGGAVKQRDNLIKNMVPGGALGLVSDTDIAWSPLPATGAPSPRSNVGRGDVDSSGNQQELWTGRVAIVYGGVDQNGQLLDGATYQPPASCVCPVDEAHDTTCAGVTNVSGTCSP